MCFGLANNIHSSVFDGLVNMNGATVCDFGGRLLHSLICLNCMRSSCFSCLLPAELDRAIPADLAPRLEAMRLPLHVPRTRRRRSDASSSSVFCLCVFCIHALIFGVSVHQSVFLRESLLIPNCVLRLIEFESLVFCCELPHCHTRRAPQATRPTMPRRSSCCWCPPTRRPRPRAHASSRSCRRAAQSHCCGRR